MKFLVRDASVELYYFGYQFLNGELSMPLWFSQEALSELDFSCFDCSENVGKIMLSLQNRTEPDLEIRVAEDGISFSSSCRICASCCLILFSGCGALADACCILPKFAKSRHRYS